MRDEWNTFNVKYFAIPMTALVFGLVIGFGISDSKKKPSKNYPIEVQCHWSTNGYSSYPKMECDSVKGDTIYKDGLMIKSKTIINVSYK
tara:strand:+ start:109 stop:375 length:267 start_codon:yes stop_codon:yes gene_type:complete